jgi:alpha-D-ribose 1-methylphosphonate 5-triphosphate diphosphatase PhnM
MPATAHPETILTRARLCLPEGMTPGTIVLRAGLIAEIDLGESRRGRSIAGATSLRPG